MNGVQRGCNWVCSVDVSPRCPRGRKTCHQETLGYSFGHGGYGDVIWVESEVRGGWSGGLGGGGAGERMCGCVEGGVGCVWGSVGEGSDWGVVPANGRWRY